MFEKIFKTQEYTPPTPYKSTEELVQEIHDNFNNYGDKLLAEAKSFLSQKFDTAKGERLAKLGFVQTKEAAEQIEIQSKIALNHEVAELIEYYADRYPLNRFITEPGVEKLCKKYNLVHGGVSRYIGKVPEKNLQEIENFKIPEKKDLSCYANYGFRNSKYKISYDNYNQYYSEESDYRMTANADKTFSICAPVKDFNTTGMKLEKNKLVLEVPDPVVLFPVNKGYLIVSAWGPEASDSQVINSKMN